MKNDLLYTLLVDTPEARRRLAWQEATEAARETTRRMALNTPLTTEEKIFFPQKHRIV